MHLARPAALLAIALLLLPAVQGGEGRARTDLDGTLAYLAGVATGGKGSDEMAPYLVETAVADHLDPAVWPNGSPALDLLRENAAENAGKPLIYRLRPAHALAVAGHLGPGDNLTKGILAAYTGGQFGDENLLNDDIWTLMTLPMAGIAKTDLRLQAAADFLLEHQDERGAWSWVSGGAGETDETGMAMEALAGVGRLDAAVGQHGLDFIANETYPGGGVPLTRPAVANCDSTVWSIRAHAAAGRPIPTDSWKFLASLRNPDGSFRYTASAPEESNIICTLEAARTLGEALHEGWGLEGYGVEPKASPGASALLCIALLIMSTIARKSLSSS